MRVYGSYEVVVIGGGASGCSAAIAAAREGAEVMLIEELGAVGGMMNISGPPGWAFSHCYNDSGERIMGGIVEEMYREMFDMGLAMREPLPQHRQVYCQNFVDIDWAGLLFFEKMRTAGVKFLLHSKAVEPVMEGDKMVGVIVENCEGRMAVMGKVIIEATGEGDIAARAGVPYKQADRTVEELDPPSITFHMDGIDWDKALQYYKAHPMEFIPEWLKFPGWETSEMAKIRLDALEKYDSLIDMVRDGIMDNIDYHDLTMQAIEAGDMHPWGDFGHFFTIRQWGNVQAAFQHTAQIPDCDTTNITEWSAGEVEARRQVVMSIKAIQKYCPGYDKSYLTRITTTMRIREGRHFEGDYTMQAEDITSNAKFYDCIAKCAMNGSRGGPFHSAATPGTAYNMAEHQLFLCGDGTYDIPYRALVPKNVEGMLLSGKNFACTPDFKRDLLPDNMIWGQACGVAAALCIKYGKTPRELEADSAEIQAVLKKQGAVLDGVK